MISSPIYPSNNQTIETIDTCWKSNLILQIKNLNQQWNGYGELIEHYNRVLDNNSILQSQCTKIQNDVDNLRSINRNLEKSSSASVELTTMTEQYKAVSDELMRNLREKGDLAHEVVRLNHALEETNEQLTKEEKKVQRIELDNENLREKLRIIELTLSNVTETKNAIQDEFQALQSQLTQLQIDYNALNPNCLKLKQQLKSVEERNQQLEVEFVRNQNRLAEMYQHEIDQFGSENSRISMKSPLNKSVFLDDDLVIISPMDLSGNSQSDTVQDSMIDCSHSSSNFQRKSSINKFSRTNVFSKLAQKFVKETNYTEDLLKRTAITCAAAHLPTKQITNWVCTNTEVYTLGFQPSGTILATGGSDKMVHLWEISHAGQQHKYHSLSGSHGAITTLDFDNENQRLLAGCSEKTAYLWSYSDQRTLKDIFNGHQSTIFTCKFASGTKLCTGSADRTIRIWDLNRRQCIETLIFASKCHDLVVIDAAGSLLSGHHDAKLRLWDSRGFHCQKEIQFDESITSLAFNAEYQQVLICFKNSTLRLFDLRQSETIHILSNEHFQIKTDTSRAILSPDGRYACAGSDNGSVIIWDLIKDGSCVQCLKKHETRVTSVAWQPEGRYIASSEKHNRIIVWG